MTTEEALPPFLRETSASSVRLNDLAHSMSMEALSVPLWGWIGGVLQVTSERCPAATLR
jgi:hypothetical protein